MLDNVANVEAFNGLVLGRAACTVTAADRLDVTAALAISSA